MLTDFAKKYWTAFVLFALSFGFRFPPLLNADSTNSDAAVVGLQALHLLKGEFSPFLWGNGYQSSVDSGFCALFFLVFGKTPLALMLSALSLHVLLTFLAFGVLCRHIAKPWALVLTLPLVFTPSSVHTYALYPPRQASLTLAFVALALVERSRDHRRASLWVALGTFVFGLAIYADPYPLVLTPVVALLVVLLAAAAPTPRERFQRVAAAVLGGATGLLPNLWLRHASGAKNGPMTLSMSVIDHNWKLLVEECLPWALSTKVYFARHTMDYLPWETGAALHGFQLVAAALMFLVAVSGLLFVGSKAIDWPARAVGFAGASIYPVAIAAFLVSVMVMDHFSMRYLAVLTLLTPFAALPLAKRLVTEKRTALFLILFVPSLISSAIGGWVGYGPFVRGIVPVTEMPKIKDDRALFRELGARGIRFATADYWTSYRLTLLSAEELIVVPLHEAQDRYPRYREQMSHAPSFAYIFDPERSFENPDETAQSFRARFTNVERMSVGALTVFVVTR